MLILTKKSVGFIFSKLAEKIEENVGVNVCVQQKSKNFENWVQVELCNILSGLVNPDNISVEEKNLDIVAGEKGETSKVEAVKLAIEIKILKLGVAGGFNKSGCTNDIKKLSGDCFAQGAEKALFCVVYYVSGKDNRTATWEKCREYLLKGENSKNSQMIPPQRIYFKYKGKQTEGYLDLIIVP